jgi:hypothetical protein
MHFPQHDPLIHKCFFHDLIFGRVGEYFKTTHTLAPFSHAPMSFNTTSAFTTLHPKSNGYFLFFLEDYKLDQDLELSSDFFKLTI